MFQTPSRDAMLNEFVSKKHTMGAVLKNPDELEKLKRSVLDILSFLKIHIVAVFFFLIFGAYSV